MSHKIQQKWCKGLKIAFPKFFKGQAVIEVGSLNVNGSIRPLFEDCRYVGVDVVKGSEVDLIMPAHELPADHTGRYGVVCSVNTLEHDMHFDKTLPRMYELLAPGGLMFISASWKFPEHGTAKRTPWASGTAQLKGEWANYYKNISPEDVMRHFKYGMFQWYMVGVCHQDVQFVGIK